MRKIFTSALRKCAGLVALVAFAVFGSASASAEAIALGTIEFGKAYEIKAFSSVTGTIAIPQNIATESDGTVRLTQDGVAPGYGGINLRVNGEIVKNTFIGFNGKYGAINDYKVKPGDVYEINEDFLMNGGKVAFFLDGVSTQPLAVQYISIRPGSTINFANYPRLTITFNQEIAAIPASGHKMYFKSHKTDALTEVNLPYSGGGWDLYSACKSQFTIGTMLPGDEFQVMLTGIRTPAGAACEDADADGNIWFTFKAGSEPLTFASQKVPSTLLSYYAPGDPESILSITFNNPLPSLENKLVIGPNTKVVIGYGDVETDGAYYTESFTPTVSEDGMTIYADLSGKLRTPRTMIPNSTSTFSEIGISIQNICDMYGNPVKANDNASLGSFSWSLPYKELERTNFVSEFTPANGETLAGVDNIEVMIYPATGYTFTGFDITYVDDKGATQKINIAKADANESVSDGVASYKFAIPEQVKGKKNVTVTLSNLVCNDGYDHTTDVMAQYDAFVITYADPSNNASLASLKANQIINIETNYIEKYPEMAVAYEVVDMNPAEGADEIVKTSADMQRQSDGSYSATIPAEVKLYAGHNYQIRFTAWATESDKNYSKEPVGTAYVTVAGTTPAYAYSITLFESIDPAEGTELGDEAPVFTVTFDGMVEIVADATVIVGDGTNVKFASIAGVDAVESDGQTFASIWKLAVPEDYFKNLDGVLTFTLAAEDMDARRVQGNKGADENSYFEFTYAKSSEYEQCTIVAVGTTPYTSVKEFTAFAPERGGISYSGYVPYEDAYVTDGRRAIVARVANVVAGDAVAGERVKEATLVLDTEITEDGSYKLFIPKNYFILGEGDDSKVSADVMYSFDVVGGTESEVKIEYTPATGEVSSLPKEIVMNFIGTTGIMTGSGAPTLTIDNGEPIKLNDVVLDDFIYTQCTLVLPQEYTEPGEYKVNFPAGYFSLGDEGDPSPAYEAVWTIKSGAAINVTTNPAQGKVESLSTIEITFVDYEEVGGGMGKATLSVNGGAPVNLPDAGWGTEFNQMEQNLGQTYTADGTYVISFPEGYFSLGSNGDASPAFTLTYTIGDNSGIAGVTVATDGLYHVYTVSGVELLTTADYAEVLALAPGLYIVNNCKVYIK